MGLIWILKLVYYLYSYPFFMPPTNRLCQCVPYYIKNANLQNDLKVSTISHLSKSCSLSFHSKLTHHTNPLIKRLSSCAIPDNPLRRLKRSWPRDLLAWPVGWYYWVPTPLCYIYCYFTQQNYLLYKFMYSLKLFF